jgi:hypothetical protein
VCSIPEFPGKRLLINIRIRRSRAIRSRMVSQSHSPGHSSYIRPPFLHPYSTSLLHLSSPPFLFVLLHLGITHPARTWTTILWTGQQGISWFPCIASLVLYPSIFIIPCGFHFQSHSNFQRSQQPVAPRVEGFPRNFHPNKSNPKFKLTYQPNPFRL